MLQKLLKQQHHLALQKADGGAATGKAGLTHQLLSVGNQRQLPTKSPADQVITNPFGNQPLKFGTVAVWLN